MIHIIRHLEQRADKAPAWGSPQGGPSVAADGRHEGPKWMSPDMGGWKGSINRFTKKTRMATSLSSEARRN